MAVSYKVAAGSTITADIKNMSVKNFTKAHSCNGRGISTMNFADIGSSYDSVGTVYDLDSRGLLLNAKMSNLNVGTLTTALLTGNSSSSTPSSVTVTGVKSQFDATLDGDKALVSTIGN